MKHTITEVRSFEASGPGALAGHEAVCSCGDVQRTSLSSAEAAKLGAAHVAFWAERIEGAVGGGPRAAREIAFAKIDANHAAAVARRSLMGGAR